jgi:predicted ribosome-associated RNA-binding protein Tma20
MFKLIKGLPIIIKTIPIVIIIVCLKMVVLNNIILNEAPLNYLIEISDISIVFTGAFFVVGLLLAATMTDFKESEKIPGEVASNLEAIKDWIFLALRSPRIGSSELCKESLNETYLRNELISVTDGIILWINSELKDSKKIFPLLRKLNEIAYYFAERGVDKEAIKGIQENTNVMRKQLTRAYSISRNNFIAPAYTLLKSILTVVFSLLVITKFKTITADYLVTISISFIFMYLYFLIVGLDDPFNISRGDTEVDLKPIDRFKTRIHEDFLRN